MIEKKKRGEDLNKHYAQAVTSWMQLKCPSYVMLCNFDEFWIYDFRKQWEEPIELLFRLRSLVVHVSSVAGTYIDIGDPNRSG